MTTDFIKMPSQAFNDLTTKLNGFMETGICDDQIHKKLRTLKFNIYEKLLNFLTNQIAINSINPIYSLYKIDTISETSSYHIDISGEIGNMYYTTIQADDRHIFLNCLNIESLLIFLVENSVKNKNNRYIFIPVVFGSEVNEVGHFSSLVFDIKENKVYFCDPNGFTNFFDNIHIIHSNRNNNYWAMQFYNNMYINSEKLIEKLITCYINDLNEKFGTEYKFISRMEWNPTKYSFNRSFNNSVIGNGHCVITTTIIINYLKNTDCNVNELYQKIGSLKNEEVLEIINSYSVGIAQIV